AAGGASEPVLGDHGGDDLVLKLGFPAIRHNALYSFARQFAGWFFTAAAAAPTAVVAFFATTASRCNSLLSKIFFRCREITDLSRANSSVNCCRLSQTVSCSSATCSC